MSPAAGTARQAMGRRREFSSRNAPTPSAPANNRDSAGARTTPKVGRPFSMRAMFTVNSPLRLMNSLVPSRGSTSQKLVRHGGGASGGRRFLGDHGNGGRELRERRQNDGLGPLIRRGDRRGIGFAPHFKVRCVDLENGSPAARAIGSSSSRSSPRLGMEFTRPVGPGRVRLPKRQCCSFARL